MNPPTEATSPPVLACGQGQRPALSHWAAAVLGNGLGRYGEALAAAEQGCEYPDELGLATMSMVELIEAAARSGRVAPAQGIRQARHQLPQAAPREAA